MSEPLTRRAFERELADLDRSALASFVADLRSRRGWEARVDGDVVVAERAGGVERLLVWPGASRLERLASPPDLPADRDVDAVVVPPDAVGGAEAYARERGARLIDADDLFERALYALDGKAGDALFREHFGREPARPTPGGATREGSEPGDAGGDPPEPPEGDGPGVEAALAGRRRAAVAGAVLLAAAVLAAAALAGGFGGSPPATTPTATPRVAEPFPTGTTAPPPAGTGTATPGAATPPTASQAVTVRNGEGTAPAGNASGVDGSRYLSMEPTCERPPGLVVAIQLGALRHNPPGTDAGVRTVWRFASPANRRVTGPFSAFVDVVRSDRYAPLFEHRRVVFGPVRERPDVRTRSGVVDAVAQRVTLLGPFGTTSYEFRLSKQRGGGYDGCWMTDAVIAVGDSTVAARWED